MAPRRVEEFVAEMERRWRLRTPAFDPAHLHARTRVSRREMIEWAQTRWDDFLDSDALDPELLRAVRGLWSRLCREFPLEFVAELPSSRSC